MARPSKQLCRAFSMNNLFLTNRPKGFTKLGAAPSAFATFDGIDDRGVYSDVDTINVNNQDFTITFWFFTSTRTENWKPVFMHGRNASNRIGISFLYTGGRVNLHCVMQDGVYNSQGRSSPTTSHVVENDTWYQFRISYSYATEQFTAWRGVAGEPMEVLPVEADPTNSFATDSEKWVGACDNPTSYGDFSVADMRIYDYAFSESNGLEGRLPEDQVLNWKFDNGASGGMTVEDTVGSNDLAIDGAVEAKFYTPAPTDYVTRFVRSEADNIKLNNTGGIRSYIDSANNDWTALLDFKCTDVTLQQALLAINRITTDRFQIYVQSSQVRASVYDGAHNSKRTGTILNDTWYRVAVTWDSATSTLTLYVATVGSSKGTAHASAGAPGSFSGTKAYIGGANTNGDNHNFGGDIDNVFFYDRVLTDTQLDRHFDDSNPSGDFEAGYDWSGGTIANIGSDSGIGATNSGAAVAVKS